MGKLAGIILFTYLITAGMAPAGGLSSGLKSEPDYSDSLVMEAVDVVEGTMVGEDSSGVEESFAIDSRRTFNFKDSSGADFECEINKDGVTATIRHGNAAGLGKLTIPSSIEWSGSEFPVTQIGQFAFSTSGNKHESPMKGVRQLIISEGILEIGQNAFDNAPDLESVKLPASLEVIPYCIFNDCRKLREIRIPRNSNIQKIESFAFAGCSSLEAFTIPSEVSLIGEGPWRGCTSLRELALQERNYDFIVSDGVLYTGWQGNLVQYPAGKREKEYQILYGTKTICNSSFYGNPYIETVSIPASLESISHMAFFECTSLRDVIFNNVVPFIGNKAFAGCTSLKEITLYGSPQYTDSQGNPYNTFPEWTSVTIQGHRPRVTLQESPRGILSSAWDHVAGMAYFYQPKMKNNEDFGFPKYLGKGKVAVSGNAGPKPDVLQVLEAIPHDYLAVENIREDGSTTRYYLDKSDEKTPRVLYFFGGTGGADLVVILFEGGNLQQIEKMFEEITRGKNVSN